jgi:hypothetical protein
MTRTRGADVSYGQIEAAAQAILASGVRPTVEGVREALKSGSQRTLLNGLQRFWKELGARISGVPDSRRRLPAQIADLADNLWQTALSLATDAAMGADTRMKEALAQLRTESEVRGHALAQREIEIDSLVRSRERTIKELEEHLRATMSLVNRRDATIQSLESRLSAALSETDTYRQRLAALVRRAVNRQRANAAPVHPRRLTPVLVRTRNTVSRVARGAPPAKTRRSPLKGSARKKPSRRPR